MKQLLGLVLFAGFVTGAVAAVTGHAAFEAEDEEPYGMRVPPLEEPAPPKLQEMNIIHMPTMYITIPKPPPPKPSSIPVKTFGMKACGPWEPLEQGGGRVQPLCRRQ